HDEGAGNGEFSAGGRPRIATTPAPLRSKTPKVGTQPVQKARTIAQPTSLASNAPMTLDDYVMPDLPMPSRIGAATPGHKSLSSTVEPSISPMVNAEAVPLNFQPARIAYTPFRYNEKLAETRSTVNDLNPADAAYTKLRKNQVNESGRLLGQDSTYLAISPGPDRSQTVTPSRAKQQQEEAFIGLLRQQSKAVRRKAVSPPPEPSSTARTTTPFARASSVPPLIAAARALRQALPTELPAMSSTKAQHPRLSPIATASTKVVDDFSFIKATVLAWDKNNRGLQDKLNAERSERESKCQERIDHLFNDNEIGYADIHGLEEDFKLKEANSKYRESQEELNSFTTSVFDTVTLRLESEIAELERLRFQALDVLDLASQSASTGMKNAMIATPDTGKVPMVQVMPLMLTVFTKLEIRYQKLAEAGFERGRRRKKLEQSILYTNGDKAGVNKLEAEYDTAQSMQVLSETRKRDERANKVMDSFDRAVVRALAENQEWTDEMLTKTQLLRDLILSESSNGPERKPDKDDLLYGAGGIKETTSTLTDAVAIVNQDSKELQDFEKLKAEKKKEDQKLKDDADNRLSGVQRGPDEILSCVKEVRDAIGVDGNHKARIDQALETAKRRNDARIPAPRSTVDGPTSMQEV
ncbi:hypothetical protein LTR66_016425, partial [Elasticomyces elasticus]